MTENKLLNPDESEHHSCEHCVGCKKKTFDNEKSITLESIFIKGISFQRNGFIKKLLKLRSVYKHAVLSSGNMSHNFSWN